MLGYLFKNIKNKESLFLSIVFIKTYLSYFNLLFLKKCMLIKKSKDSLAILTDVVLPGETNALNNLFGGELLARMDRAGSISAQRHSRNIVVTASVNHVVFRKVIPVGSVVTIEAKVSRAFNSSMEVYVDVWIEDRKTGDLTKVNEGIYTFGAVDRLGSPVKVSAIKRNNKSN